MRIVNLVWSYLGKTQPVWVRVLHLLILLMVCLQLITSNFVEIEAGYQSAGSAAFTSGTWAHVLPGLTLLGIMLIFVLTEFLRRGVKYFFPYLWGDVGQLKADLKTLLQRRLPEATPGGLAASVQGLGLGAVGLTLLSGALWFALIQAGSGLAHTAIEVHEVMTGVVIAYLIGHGGMGLLHMLLWIRAGADQPRA